MKIIGVNGINTHGETNIDVLLNELARYGNTVVDVSLPKRHILTARFAAKADAQHILDVAEEGDVIIAHSFGCLRAAKAMERRRFSQVFMFRPAMSKHYFDKQEHLLRETLVHCIHSKDDVAILVGSWLLCHPFGAAGRVGFTHPWVRNERSSGDHGSDFNQHLSKYAAYVNKWV